MHRVLVNNSSSMEAGDLSSLATWYADWLGPGL